MKKRVNTCVLIGAGAIGASLGVLLTARYGNEVFVAAQGDRAFRYKRDGFTVNGNSWRPGVEELTEHMRQYDLIIIAVKFYQIPEVLPMIDELLSEGTQIISLLNGLASEEILIERYGAEHVLYALTVGQDAVRVGQNVTYTNAGKIVLGERHNKQSFWSKRVTMTAAYLKEAGVVVEVPEDMEYQLWWKLMVNVGVNQASALFRKPYGSFQHPGKEFNLMKKLMLEVIELSHYTGSSLSYKDFLQWCDLLQLLNPEGKTSMLQDIEAGRETEVDLFSGTIVKKAKALGLHLPVNESVLDQIRSIRTS